jgi:nucleotide-binding universal stress UspA family protein
MTAERLPVVVGVGWSAESRAAVDYAVDLASRKSIPLRLVHAVEAENVAAWSTIGWTPDLNVARGDAARQLVADTAADVQSAHPDLEIQTAIAEGSCNAVLVHESQHAHTVVVGSRRSSGLASLLLGSTTLDIGLRAACPLIAVPHLPDDADDADGTAAGRPARRGVVVGVNGSPHSQHTLGYAFAQAAELGEPVVVVHTWTEPPVADPSMATPMAYAGGTCEEDERQVLEHCLTGWQERYPDVRLERCVQHSRPVAELVARSANARLLVIGSHGAGAFRSLLASVCRGVLHSARVPVAIIHATPVETAAPPAGGS